MMRVLTFLVLAVLAFAESSFASVTFSTAMQTTIDTSTASTTKTCVLSQDVPAGATIIGIYMNRTNETATLDSVSDPVNGTWTSPTLTPTPIDASNGTARTWMVRRHNSAALTGAGNRTLTFTTSAGVSSQIVCGWMNSSLGAMTDDQADASPPNTSSNATPADTSSLTPSSQPGVLVCGWTVNNSQTAVPTQNNGVTNWNTQVSGNRAFLGYLAFSSTSAIFCDTDLSVASNTVAPSYTFLEPSTAITFYNRRTRVNP